MKTTTAKTSIMDELDIPADRKAVLSREALRRGIPVNQLVKQVLLNTADRITGAAGNNQLSEQAA